MVITSKSAAALLLFTSLLVACADAGTTTSSITPSTIAPPTTTPPPTTGPTSTTIVPTSIASVDGPVLVAADRTVGDPALVFIDMTGSVRVRIPLDRRTPGAGVAVSDGAGGFVVLTTPPNQPEHSIVWWPGGAGTWARVDLAPDFTWISYDDPPSVISDSGGRPALFYTVTDWTSHHDADAGVDVGEARTEVRLQVLGEASHRTLLENLHVTRFRRGEETEVGARLTAAAAGGDMFVVGWHAQVETGEWCDWLEAKLISTGEPTVPHPRFGDVRCDDQYISTLAMSADGDLLLELSGYGQDATLHVYDLETGATALELPAGDGIFFDGDHILAVVSELAAPNGSALSVIRLGTVSATGFDATRFVIDDRALRPIGVLPGLPTLPAGATLASSEPTTPCSGTGLELPEDAGLPAAVAATRTPMAMAAERCDFVALAALATELRWQHHDICGDGYETIDNVDPVGEWYETERSARHMQALIETLATSPEVRDDAGGRVWVWKTGLQIVEIDESGMWIFERFIPPPDEPCETIWCTC